MSLTQKTVIDLYINHGLPKCHTITMLGNVTKRTYSELKRLAGQGNEKASSLLWALPDPNRDTNRKAFKLIRVMAENDFNLRQAADAMNMALDTANKHIRTAKNMLEVKTTAGMIYKAMKEGIIE